MATLTVDKSQLTLVRETKELLEELLETLDVMADKRLLRDIKISRSQASKGQTRGFRRLMAESDLEPSTQSLVPLTVRLTASSN